jgi:hypothetical protein
MLELAKKKKVTNSMEQSHSSEANSISANQETIFYGTRKFITVHIRACRFSLF